MAISLHTSGDWAFAASGSVTPTLPTHASGDMLLARVVYKSSDIANCLASTATSGWAKVGEFHSGTTNSGNGTGSVAVAAFWKVATSASETAPTVDFSQTVTQVGHVALSYQKGAGEEFITPVGDGGPEEVQDAGKSITIQSHVSVTAGDMVDVFFGVRDDCTVTVPTFTQTGVTYGVVSEQPAAAGTNTDGADGAYDGCYRLASSGTSSAAAVCTCTLSTSEWAAAWMTRLRVGAPSTNVQPDPVATTGAVMVPTVDKVYTIQPSPTAATLAVPAPSIPYDQTVAPSPVAASAAVTAPTIATPLGLTPDPIAATSAVTAPTIATPVSLSPLPVAAATAAPAPAVASVVTLSPAPTGAATAVPAPTVEQPGGGPVTLTPDPVAALSAVTAPAVASVMTLGPAPVAATAAVTAPMLATPLGLAPAPVAAVTAVPAPTLEVPGGVLTITPDPVPLAVTVTMPVLASVLGLEPGPVAATLSVPAPVLGLLLALQPAPVATTTRVPLPDLGFAVPGLAARMRPAYADQRVYLSAPPESRAVGARRL